MDGFTAGLLLQVAIDGHPGEAANIAKQLAGAGPQSEVVAQVEAMTGKRCRINHTPYTGTVHGVNKARGGFYGGEKFPVLVKIDETCDGNKGVVFEYALEQVTLADV